MSYLINFLPAYLFPNAERTVARWLVAGISLGGHSTWLVLRNGAHVPSLCSWIPCAALSSADSHAGAVQTRA